MPLEVRLTPRAEQDLLDIWAYIAGDSRRAADNLLDRFGHLLGMLAENPLAGRARPELARDLRSFTAGRYVLFYRVDAEALVLVRALSGSLDIGEHDFQ